MSRSTDPLLERLGAEQASVREQGRTDRHARVLSRLHASIERDVAPNRRGWIVGGAVLASAAALALWMVRSTPLSFEVERSAHPGVLQAVVAESQPLTMRFSDGSTVELEIGTRVRVGEPRVDGVDLVLEQGTVEAHLEPGDGGSWVVLAGPHVLPLTGGTSRIHWTPEEQRLRVESPDGDFVRGGVPDEPPKTGQDVSAPPDREPIAEPPPAEQHTAPRVRPQAPVSRARTPGADVPASRDDWKALARRGAHREALVLAEDRGFTNLCTKLEVDDLLLLADTARYARRPSRAREALQALRRRFPGTDAAATAAFDLGRLATRGAADCPTWFRTYLDERPQGSMAEAARKRLEQCETE